MQNQDVRSVVFLPGIVTPVAIQYKPLLEALQGAGVSPIFQDLEVYREDTPPKNYSLDLEIEGLRAVIAAEGLAKAHLVAYSGGGTVALAYLGRYPDQVASLAVTEPAVIPNQGWFQQEREKWAEMDRLMALPTEEQMPAFVRFHLKPDVPVSSPPAGTTPPAWMAQRPAGIQAFVRAIRHYHLNLDRLRLFTGPVYLAAGGLSDEIELRKAEVLSKYFADFRLEVYESRHHFDPPQRAEPERYARALLDLWNRAEQLKDETRQGRVGS